MFISILSVFLMLRTKVDCLGYLKSLKVKGTGKIAHFVRYTKHEHGNLTVTHLRSTKAG